MKVPKDKLFMEDINHFASLFVDELAKRVGLTVEDEDKLYDLFVDKLSEHFRCCDYRRYL